MKKQPLNEEFRRMQKLAGLITESQINEAESLLSLIQDYIGYDYTADQGYGTTIDKKTGEEIDVVDNAEKEMERIEKEIISQKGSNYFELVKKYAGLNTYNDEYAGPEESDKIEAQLEELASELGFTPNQLG